MSILDIATNKVEDVTDIRIDGSKYLTNATKSTKAFLRDDGQPASFIIPNRLTAEQLIKAIQAAIDMGWFEQDSFVPTPRDK